MIFWLFSGFDQKSGALVSSSILASWVFRVKASKIAPHSVSLLAERRVLALQFLECHLQISVAYAVKFRRMVPRRSPHDWLLEAMAFTALIATFAMVFGHWQRLPVYARRGSGGSLTIMVLLNAGVYVLLTVASRYQQLINVPFEIDRDRPEVKQLLLDMTIMLKTVLMVLLAGLLWMIVHTPIGRIRGSSRVYLVVFLTVMLAQTIFYIRKLDRFRK